MAVAAATPVLFGTAATSAAVPPPPPNPSESEIDPGRAIADNRVGQVGRLVGRLAAVEARLSQLSGYFGLKQA